MIESCSSRCDEESSSDMGLEVLLSGLVSAEGMTFS